MIDISRQDNADTVLRITPRNTNQSILFSMMSALTAQNWLNNAAIDSIMIAATSVLVQLMRRTACPVYSLSVLQRMKLKL